MNIFAIEKTYDNKIDWIKSAQSQDNYRVVKMILESCQMLCTNLNYLHDYKISPYRSCHINHPSTKWARESSGNFERLIEHTYALIDEYGVRFGKTHKCEAVLDKVVDIYDASMFQKHVETPLALCMPDIFKKDCIVESYRRFYSSKPKMRYPKDKIPSWFIKYRGEVPFTIV